ncbi:MAG: 3-hydroxybutyryl-CoA dehydrogenase [Thermomicrobiales bacterium]|nr:3-hydroxybutyryl-CoA dehydrogenase [Thermomicrobiales bacterium]
MEFGPIAVIGAGTLGWQIALTFAARGVTVRLHDASAETLEQALARIGREAQGLTDAGVLPAEAAGAAERLVPAGSLAEAVEGVWLAIEAIPERLEAKRELFTELSRLAGPEVILATNSSSFRSRLLAEATLHPERLLNTHFYGEPWRRSAVELMTCGATDPPHLERVADFMTVCGLTPFVVRGESTGFIFNRIWRAIKRESLRVVAEGHATPEEVDRLWCLVMESAPGPFARMDRVGLDVVLDIERRYAAESGDPDDDPPALLVELVERGMLGVKSGRGFYEYGVED